MPINRGYTPLNIDVNFIVDFQILRFFPCFHESRNFMILFFYNSSLENLMVKSLKSFQHQIEIQAPMEISNIARNKEVIDMRCCLSNEKQWPCLENISGF